MILAQFRGGIGALFFGGLLGLTALLAACNPDTVPDAPVAAAQYDRFWLWPGVTPGRRIDHAKALYVLHGEVRADEQGRIVQLRAPMRLPRSAEFWLVLRVETLAWKPAVYHQLALAIARWEKAGNRLRGIQIDFDAETRQLDRYAQFLSDVRQRLPARYALSITGLLDWSAQGDPAALAALAGVVDDIVLQSYQGRRTIPGYARWLRRLSALPIPFYIGVVEGGAWREPKHLRRQEHFRGYVVFLL